MTRSFASNLSWLAVAQIGRRAWSLLVTAVLAHILAPRDFGTIALVTLISGALTICADIGLTGALIQREQLDEDHLTSAFWLNVVVSGCLTLFGIGIAYPVSRFFHQPALVTIAPPMMLTLLIASVGSVPGVLLQRRMRFRELALVDMSAAIGAGLISVSLALGGSGVWSIVAQYLAYSTLSATARIVCSKWAPSLRFCWKSSRDLLGYGTTVLAAALLNYVVGNIDNALIGRSLGANALGLYVLAYNLTSLIALSFNGIVAQVLFPTLSRLRDDPAKMREEYLGAIRMVAVVTFPCLTGLAATAPQVVHAFYGPKWAGAAPVLEIIAIGALLPCINMATLAINALGKPALNLKWAFLSAIILSFGFVVGVRWGILGVAWSYTLLTPIAFLVPQFFAARMMSLPARSLFGAFLPILAIAAAMAGVVRLASGVMLVSRSPLLNLAALVAGGALIYLGLLLAYDLLWNKGRGYRTALTAWRNITRGGNAIATPTDVGGCPS